MQTNQTGQLTLRTECNKFTQIQKQTHEDTKHEQQYSDDDDEDGKGIDFEIV